MDSRPQTDNPSPPFPPGGTPFPDIQGLCLGIRDYQGRPQSGIQILKIPLPPAFGGGGYAPFPGSDTHDIGNPPDPAEPPTPPSTAEQAAAIEGYYQGLQHPSQDDIHQYANDTTVNEYLVRKIIARILADKHIHIHEKERKVLIWFAETLETKSFLDLRAVPDERERWTFHVANSIVTEYFWYHWARRNKDWKFTDTADLSHFGHNVNRKQFYRRLIHPHVTYEGDCKKCGTQAFVYWYTKKVEAKWRCPVCKKCTVGWELVSFYTPINESGWA
jgi:hypothetical protein